jgi:hypothetical protein
MAKSNDITITKELELLIAQKRLRHILNQRHFFEKYFAYAFTLVVD